MKFTAKTRDEHPLLRECVMHALSFPNCTPIEVTFATGYTFRLSRTKDDLFVRCINNGLPNNPFFVYDECDLRVFLHEAGETTNDLEVGLSFAKLTTICD